MIRCRTSTGSGLLKASTGRTGAFTFIEVVIALTIVSISLMALLKLQLVSVRTVGRAQATSQAVFLANEKIAETLAGGYPEEGTDSGVADKNGLSLNWRTEVAELRPPDLDEARITGLRSVLVDVSWQQGAGRHNLRMSTYVADRKMP